MLFVGLAVILLLLLMGGKKSPATGKSSGIVAKLAGVDLAVKEREFQNAKSDRDVAMQFKGKFIELENKVELHKNEFWSFNKLGSPRGEVQQKIISLGKNVGLEDIRVSTGFERAVTNSNYLRVIDYTVSSKDFTMKKVTDFMQAIDAEVNKIYWDDCKILKIGNSLSFSANLRIYVFNKKAVELMGKN